MLKMQLKHIPYHFFNNKTTYYICGVLFIVLFLIGIHFNPNTVSGLHYMYLSARVGSGTINIDNANSYLRFKAKEVY